MERTIWKGLQKILDENPDIRIPLTLEQIENKEEAPSNSDYEIGDALCSARTLSSRVNA